MKTVANQQKINVYPNSLSYNSGLPNIPNRHVGKPLLVIGAWNISNSNSDGEPKVELDEHVMYELELEVVFCKNLIYV